MKFVILISSVALLLALGTVAVVDSAAPTTTTTIVPKVPQPIFDHTVVGGKAPAHAEHSIEQQFAEDYAWSNNNLFDDLYPDGNCFALHNSAALHPDYNISLRVEFSFEQTDPKEKRPVFFTTTNQPQVHFCLDEFVFLNRMRHFYLHLIRDGSPPEGTSVEVKLYRVKGHHRNIVQEQGNATLSGGWLFYSHQLDLSFEVSHKTDKVFRICDFIGRCAEMHREASPKNASGTVYRVPDVVHDQLIKTSPFVRIEDEHHKQHPAGGDSDYRLQYNRANQRSSERLERHFPNTVRTSPTVFSYTQKVTRAANQLAVQLPVSAFDVRIQQVLVSVTVLNGQSSSIRSTGWRHLPTGYIFNVPAGLNADAPQVNVTSEEFLSLGLDELHDPELLAQVLELNYELVFDDESFGPDDTLQVRVGFEVKSLDTFIHTNTKSFLGGLTAFPREDFMEPHVRSNLTNRNHERLDWTTWTYDRSDSAVVNASHDIYTTINFSFDVNTFGTEKNVTIDSENLKIERIILGSRGQHFARTQLKFHFNANHTKAELHDPIHYSELPQVERFFKLGYLVKLGEELEWGDLNSSEGFTFYLHNFDHSENCKHVPTFAEFNCDQQRFECPEGYFEYDEVKGACRLRH